MRNQIANSGRLRRKKPVCAASRWMRAFCATKRKPSPSHAGKRKIARKNTARRKISRLMHALLDIDCAMQNCRAGTQWRNHGKECRSGRPPRGGMVPMKRRRVARALRSWAGGLRRSFKFGGLTAGRASRNRMLPVSGQPVYCAKSRNHELRDASLRCQGGIAQSTRGLKRPEVQASGIAGVEELQSFRGCSASAVVPVNLLRAGGPRMGCRNYRTASVLSGATTHCATGAKMSSGPKNPATRFRLKKASTIPHPLSAQTKSRL